MLLTHCRVADLEFENERLKEEIERLKSLVGERKVKAETRQDEMIVKIEGGGEETKVEEKEEPDPKHSQNESGEWSVVTSKKHRRNSSKTLNIKT